MKRKDQMNNKQPIKQLKIQQLIKRKLKRK